MPSLSFQAGPSAAEIEASLHGVAQAHLTLSMRPCCSAPCRIFSASGAVKTSTTPPPSPAALASLSAVPGPSVIGTVSWNALAGRLFSLASSVTPRLLKSPPGNLRPRHGEPLDLLAHEVLRRAERGEVRAHVHVADVAPEVALAGDAGRDDVDVVLLVVLVVDVAVDDARAAGQSEHLLLLEQLGGQRGDLLRVGLLGLGDVLDGPAVDAAVVVDAVEDGLRRLGDVGEVDTRLLGDDGADLDGLARGLLAVAEAALRRSADAAVVEAPSPPPPPLAESLSSSLPHAPTARASANAAITASTRGPAGFNLVRNGPSPESDETGLRPTVQTTGY